MRWPFSAILLGAFGVTLIGMGVYFVAIRPALLPEDLRFIGITVQQVENTMPGLPIWLGHVFRVMGGYIAATGILILRLALTSFRCRERGAWLTALISGLTSIGCMVLTNVLIDSDFKWLLVGIGVLWGASLTAFLWETRSLESRP